MVLGLVVFNFRSDASYHLGVLHHGSPEACHKLALGKVVFSTFFIGIYLLATRDVTISRFFLFSFLPLMYLILFITDWWLPKPLARRIFKGVHEQRTLLVGSTYRAIGFLSWLNKKEVLGVQCVGVLTDDDHGTEPGRKFKSDIYRKFKKEGGPPFLGGIEDLERAIKEHDVTHVILLEYPLFSEMIMKVVYVCDKMGIRLLMVDNLEEKVLHPITYFEEDGIRFFCMRDEPLQSPVNRMIKRTVDIVISLPVVLFILPPLALVVWILQRIYSPGPLFYWQRRAGLQNPDPARQASPDDTRIYPGARHLRRFSIDELPQFWNVLRGDMSVVGPRPHLVEHNERFAKILDSYYIRAFVKPGITGLAQIKGYRGETKNDEDLIYRIQWDLYYIENWSLELELTIIFNTFKVILLPHERAY
jgi:putative colanic acid biosynthesis UDP-glucose lipid carrier transferase